jgi:hypothetical protein
MKKLFLTNFSLVLFLTSDIAFGASEFWISPSPVTATKPPIPGGSINNPLDGSTAAKFDGAMRSIPPYSVIHLGPGTYQTMGDTTAGGAGWGPKTGWVIAGSGMYLTTLQFPSNAVVSGALNRGHLIKVTSSPFFQTNITVKDLTLDCNYQSNLDAASNLNLALKASARDGAFTLDGISLIGSGNRIENVRCINTAAVTTSATNYAEAWGIFCVPAPFPDAAGNVIEGCVVSDSHSNFKNDLVALGLMAGSGIIRSNFITQSGTNAMIGILVGTHDVVMDGNILNGVTCGSHYDSGYGITNVTIVNNDFNGCNEAIDWENGVVQDVTIASNNIVLTNTTGKASATVEAFFFHPAPSAFYNLAIRDNSVRVAGKFPNQRFVFAYNSHGLVVSGNRVDAALPSYFSGCTGITMMDNYDLTGNPLPTPQIILPTRP